MIRNFRRPSIWRQQLVKVGMRMMSGYPEPTEARKNELIEAYERAKTEVDQVAAASGPAAGAESKPVRLVAVSKLKPASDIYALYQHGVRHFGENYVQELVQKAQSLPPDIEWHFIGGLQSGKCKDLGKGIENLYAVETIDGLKKCKKLNEARKAANGKKINIYLQINTSGEDQKSGYSLTNLEVLYETVDYLLNPQECTHLYFKGLMTIGSFAESVNEGEENADFKKLFDLKESLAKKYNLELELSMGMSTDFKQAIKQGSSAVRIGSSIFGQRPPRNGH